MKHNIFNKKIIIDEDAANNLINCKTVSAKDLKSVDTKTLKSEELVEWFDHFERSMYFITQVDVQKDGSFVNQCGGYFRKFEDAEYHVINNITDLWETCFDYIVIENIPEGLHKVDHNPHWYKYNHDTEKYEEISEPKFARHYVGFALG